MIKVDSNDHLDPGQELTLEIIKSRAVRGVAALTSRTIILQIINRAGDFLLTIFLGVAQYGVFWIVSAVINFLAYFSDIGLGAALIQKKEKVTEEELRATFTIQQILVLSILLILFLITPLLQRFYHLSNEAVWLLYSLGFSFFLSSLKTIPSILLERKIDFAKLIIPQIGEVIIFNLVAVYFAWNGSGIWAFTYAVLARGLVGLSLMYLVSPWKPGLSFSFGSVKSLFRFGIPYQANTFLAVIKDDGMSIVLGGILGATGMGLLGWAQRWAYAPLRFFMDQVIKVSFPALSRIQDDKAELSKILSRSIFFISFLVFPFSIGLITVTPMLIEIIPKYDKWQPALIALALISVNTFWAAVTTPLTNMLSATSRIGTTFKLMIMWTILSWILIPALSISFGVNGAALGYALVGFSSIIAIIIAKRVVSVDLWANAGKPFLGALIMGVVIYFVRGILPSSFASVFILMILGALTYILAAFLLVGKSLITDSKKIISRLGIK